MFCSFFFSRESCDDNLLTCSTSRNKSVPPWSDYCIVEVPIYRHKIPEVIRAAPFSRKNMMYIQIFPSRPVIRIPSINPLFDEFPSCDIIPCYSILLGYPRPLVLRRKRYILPCTRISHPRMRMTFTINRPTGTIMHHPLPSPHGKGMILGYVLEEILGPWTLLRPWPLHLPGQMHMLPRW